MGGPKDHKIILKKKTSLETSFKVTDKVDQNTGHFRHFLPTHIRFTVIG